MEKKDIKKILILLGILLFIIAWRVLFGDNYNYDGVVTSYDEGYAVINDAIMKGKGNIHFECTVYPSFSDFDRILGDAVESGSYAGCEIYSIKYYSEPKGGYYDVTVEIENPNRLSSLLMEWRAGRIASHFEDLPTDYDKVKAAHDYLVLLNRYSYIEGGAFSALYKERSSCTGYAYAFYAIMNKLEIPVTIEVGGNHAWNRVMVDGKWYNIDVTWDDPDDKEISYSYFLKCDADWRGHHHGGATAETSLEPVGNAALKNFDLVPSYNRYREILIILLVILPVGILAYKVYRHGQKEKDITDNALMVVGDWNYMPPMRNGDRFDVIVKRNIKSGQTEIWYEELNRYYIEKAVDDAVINLEEIPFERFSSEVNFLIMSSGANKNMRYHESLKNAAGQLATLQNAGATGTQQGAQNAVVAGQQPGMQNAVVAGQQPGMQNAVVAGQQPGMQNAVVAGQQSGVWNAGASGQQQGAQTVSTPGYQPGVLNRNATGQNAVSANADAGQGTAQTPEMSGLPDFVPRDSAKGLPDLVPNDSEKDLPDFVSKD